MIKNTANTCEVSQYDYIILDSGHVITRAERWMIYNTALRIYSIRSTEDEMFAGLCQCIHHAGVYLGYWKKLERITKRTRIINGVNIPYYYIIGFNKEFPELMIAAKNQKANLDSDELNGYWWKLEDTKPRIATMEQAISMCTERFARKTASVDD